MRSIFGSRNRVLTYFLTEDDEHSEKCSSSSCVDLSQLPLPFPTSPSLPVSLEPGQSGAGGRSEPARSPFRRPTRVLVQAVKPIRAATKDGPTISASSTRGRPVAAALTRAAMREPDSHTGRAPTASTARSRWSRSWSWGWSRSWSWGWG